MTWHNQNWATSKQLITVGSLTRKQATVDAKLRQIRQNILRSFCLFLRRKVKSIETLDNYQKCAQQLYFHPWSPRHSSPINTSGFEGWKQEFWKQIFSHVENIPTYKALHKQSKFQALSLYLLDLLFRICYCKSQTSVEYLFDPNKTSLYKVCYNSHVYWAK